MVHGQLQPAREGFCFLHKEWFGLRLPHRCPQTHPPAHNRIKRGKHGNKKGEREGELLWKLYQKVPVYPKASLPGWGLRTADFLYNWKLYNMWAKTELIITCSIYYCPQVYNLWIDAYCWCWLLPLKYFKILKATVHSDTKTTGLRGENGR